MHARKLDGSRRADPAVEHLERVVWQAEGFTKGEVVTYYEAVAARMVPLLRGRPLALLRCPRGEGSAFLQKNFTRLPGWMRAIPRRSAKGAQGVQPVVDDPRGLRYLAGIDAIELHVEAVRAEQLDRPDLMIFDLDPQGITFAKVMEGAKLLHDVLAEVGLASWVKTSGGRGLHVLVPIAPELEHGAVRQVARTLASRAVSREPGLFSLAARKAARARRLYIDVLRNAPRATLAAAYSLRLRPAAPVSMPLFWSELVPSLSPLEFTLRTAPARVRLADPFADLFDAPHTLSALAEALAA